MNTRTMAQLCSLQTGYTQKEVREIIDWFLDEMKNQLYDNNSVNVSNLGRFEVVERKSRQHAHPVTGETCSAKEYTTVKYIPSSSLMRNLIERNERNCVKNLKERKRRIT